MKRLKLKINRNLILAVAFAGIMGATAYSGGIEAAGTTLAFTGLVAGLKKEKKWDDLDEDTKAFAEQADKVSEAAEKEHEALKKKHDELKAELKDFKEKFGDLNIEDLPKDLKTKFEELQGSVKAQAELIEKLTERMELTGKTGAIAAALKEKADDILKFKSGSIKQLTIEVKTGTPADIATHTIGERVPGIGQLPVRRPFLEDIFRTVNVNKEYVRYMDQETITRDAKNVLDVNATTHNTAVTWKERNIQICKVRDFVHVSLDMMDDYDFVEGEIRRLLETSVQLKVDNGLLLDDGAAPNLHSVDEVSSEFDAANTLGGTIEEWQDKVDTPNIFDLVIAMSSQIMAIGKENMYMPDTVLWNSIDKYKAMLIKDKNGQYLMPPFVVKVGDNEYSIDNMRVRANPNVPANTMYVFDSSKGVIYARKGLTLEMSYENGTNFQTETVTIKALRRLNLLIRNVDQDAFMKCSDIDAALTAIDSAV